ncbi:MAG: tetratricopeptide repeat protein [Planctomycetota bacterium]
MPVTTRLTDPAALRRRRQLACATREAEGYLELGMPGDALETLERRGRLVLGDARASYLMGESLRELRRFREAIFPLRRSVRLAAQETRAWLALGWCCKRSGRLREAIAALERAVTIAPSEAVLHYNLACYCCLAGRRLDALRRLRTAFRLDRKLVELVDAEEDLDPIRRDPALRMLLRAIA